MKIHKGRLERWNEDKGFGFVESYSDKKGIFIHISAFKRMGRRPTEGDMIEYQIHIENDEKKRAVNASIEGAVRVKPDFKRSPRKHYNESKHWLPKLIPIVLFITIVVIYANNFMTYNSIKDRGNSSSLVKPILEDSSIQDDYSNQVYYSCDGKTYCSEMTSCEEATFYQNNCSGTKMDGDGDGIPCESQWCSW